MRRSKRREGAAALGKEAHRSAGGGDVRSLLRMDPITGYSAKSGAKIDAGAPAMREQTKADTGTAEAGHRRSKIE